MATPYPETTSGDRLSFTLFVAAAVHAMIIFGISFSVNNGQKIAPTLNITLATHKDKLAPEKADFLAQHNQQASGTADEIKELTALAPSEISDIHIREVNPVAQQKATSESRSNTRILSTQRPQDWQVAQLQEPDKQINREEKKGEQFDAPISNPEFASLSAQLDADRQEYAKQPRIRRLTSVATKTSYEAQYMNNWIKKVQLIGKNNFPQEALDNEIFGSLRVAVLIDRMGIVKNIDITQSSGHRVLDDAALQIIRLASPFNRLPPEILKHTDQLEIIRTWNFEITGMSTSH